MVNHPAKNLLSALMELSGALLGAIEPSLRAATVNLDFEQEFYIYYFYYDGAINDYMKELVIGASSEAATTWFYKPYLIQLDYPAPIPPTGAFVYLRREEGVLPPYIHLIPRDSETIASAYLSYALGQGLLGRVIPSLRRALIDVDEKEKKMGFYFYYDEEITENILILSKEAIAIAKTAFPSDFVSIEIIEFIPSPQSFPHTGTKLVYERNEHLFD